MCMCVYVWIHGCVWMYVYMRVCVCVFVWERKEGGGGRRCGRLIKNLHESEREQCKKWSMSTAKLRFVCWAQRTVYLNFPHFHFWCSSSLTSRAVDSVRVALSSGPALESKQSGKEEFFYHTLYLVMRVKWRQSAFAKTVGRHQFSLIK